MNSLLRESANFDLQQTFIWSIFPKLQNGSLVTVYGLSHPPCLFGLIRFESTEERSNKRLQPKLYSKYTWKWLKKVKFWQLFWRFEIKRFHSRIRLRGFTHRKVQNNVLQWISNLPFLAFFKVDNSCKRLVNPTPARSAASHPLSPFVVGL